MGEDDDAAERAEAATLGGELEEEQYGEAELGGELEEEADREAPPWAGVHACRCQPDQTDKQHPTWSSLHDPWGTIRQGAPGDGRQARFKEQTNRACEAS